MRIALAGKGGAGKTTIAATLARLLASDGFDVVAIDADSNPNLASALGVATDDANQAPHALPSSIVSRRLDGPGLKDGVDAVLAAHGVVAPDGVRLAHMGMPAHADEGCMCAAHATVSSLLADLGDRPRGMTIVDMEASPEHLSRGTARHVDLLLLVAEPYYRALETARRLAALAAQLPIARVAVVANKVRGEADGEVITAFCERHDLELLAVVPWGEEVLDADAARQPLVEAAASGPVVAAVRRLVAALGLPDAGAVPQADAIAGRHGPR
ncbi:MAG: P-loop NTPase [Euzebyales bacterium]|nr:P-loop NTPase [Euzebyales bacterium]